MKKIFVEMLFGIFFVMASICGAESVIIQDQNEVVNEVNYEIVDYNVGDIGEKEFSITYHSETHNKNEVLYPEGYVFFTGNIDPENEKMIPDTGELASYSENSGWDLKANFDVGAEEKATGEAKVNFEHQATTSVETINVGTEESPYNFFVSKASDNNTLFMRVSAEKEGQGEIREASLFAANPDDPEAPITTRNVAMIGNVDTDDLGVRVSTGNTFYVNANRNEIGPMDENGSIIDNSGQLIINSAGINSSTAYVSEDGLTKGGIAKSSFIGEVIGDNEGSSNIINGGPYNKNGENISGTTLRAEGDINIISNKGNGTSLISEDSIDVHYSINNPSGLIGAKNVEATGENYHKLSIQGGQIHIEKRNTVSVSITR